MNEIVKIIIGTAIVILGFPLGSLLKSKTKDELKKGQVWFRAIILLSFAGAIISIILRNDALFFTFLFISAVTSKSIITKKRKRKKLN